MKHALFAGLLSAAGIVFFSPAMSYGGSSQRVDAGIPQHLNLPFHTADINATTVAEEAPGRSKKNKKKMSKQMNKKKKKGKRK